MNKKYKNLIKSTIILTSADYMCNAIKLNIYENYKIFNTKRIKIEFRNKDTDELIHTIDMQSKKTIDEYLK